VTPNDQAARDLVRYDFTVNLAVEAGAGTGKTTLLVDRAYEAVVTHRLPIRTVALVTFMEKAAAELRERLGDRLRRALETGGSDAAWIRAQLLDLPEAPITTLHGLGHRLLRSEAHRLWGTAEPEVWDAVEAERQRTRAFHAWMGERDAARRLWATLREVGVSWPQWEALITSLPASGTFIAPAALPEAVPPLIRAWAREMAALAEAARRTGVSPEEPGCAQIAELARYGERLLALPPSAWTGFLLDLRWGAAKGSQERWKPHQAVLRHQKERLQAWQERLDEWRRAWAEATLAALWEEAAHFRRYWDAWRRRAGAMTFGDQIERAVHLLREDAVVRARESRGLRLLMVDEFQDTDPLQVEMVQWLAQDPDDRAANPAEAVIPPGRLVVVGDVKQSIYGFRGADVANAVGWMTRLVDTGQARRVEITENFRSHAMLVTAVNRVFSTLMDGTPPHPRYIPLTVGRQDPESGERLRVYRLPVAAGTEASVRESEARAAAAFMARALAEAWTVRPPDEAPRPVRLSDMALLLPRRTGLELFREALERAGLRVLAAGARRFYERPEIRGLAAVLRAVTLPEDASAVLAALRGLVFRIPDAALGAYAAAGGTWHPAEKSPPGPAASALARLEEWTRQAGRLGASGVLAQAWALTGDGDPERLANVDKLLAQARRYERRWGMGAYARWLWDRVRQGDPEDEAEAPGLEGVRLTSIHQAKGLEWPLVVVTGLGGRGATDEVVRVDVAGGRVAARIAGIGSREWENVRALADQAREAEARRLWYVAFTRARDYLAVSEAAPAVLRAQIAAWPLFDPDEGKPV
jgi:ATP-dependent exoDNAse (exonuclease V) beta subunit